VEDRRRIVRSRVFKGATILVGNSPVIECIVRDVTNIGARLQIAKFIDVPVVFDLTLDGGRTIRPCKVVWRELTETGVEFLPSTLHAAKCGSG
jgi:PilZ domain